MKIDKKRIEGIALGLLTLSLLCTAILTGKEITDKQNTVALESIERIGSNTAGVYNDIKAAQTMLFTAGVEQVRSDVVALSNEELSDYSDTESDEEDYSADELDDELDDEDYSDYIDVEPNNIHSLESKNGTVLDVSGKECSHTSWYNQGMTTASDYLNIREEKSINSKTIARMYSDTVVKVIKYGNSWTKVKANGIKGYVATNYLIVGDEAYNNYLANCEEMVVVSSDDSNILAKAKDTAKILSVANTGDVLVYNTKAKETEGWIAVITDDGKGFISSENASVERVKGELITLEEEKKIEEEERKAKEEEYQKMLESGEFVSGLSGEYEVTYNDPIVATDEERTLLAGIIYCESSPHSYDGQVAVGAVVLNRVRHSAYPDTIYDVIYQKYQFGPARSGKLKSVMEKGEITESCYRAADEALYGIDPTGGLLHFNSASARKSGLNIGGNVFY